MASINGIYAEMENSSATLTKLIADGAAATTEAAEVASAAVDLKFAVAAENVSCSWLYHKVLPGVPVH